jgi:hypothetical protein
MSVKCNCAWNPDSHHETCPVYMRDRIADLAADNQRLEGEVASLRNGLVELLSMISSRGLSPVLTEDELARIDAKLASL